MIMPEDQFQIGDYVVYVSGGIITRVTGYEWLIQMDTPPLVALYRLDCGINVTRSCIRAATSAEVRRIS